MLFDGLAAPAGIDRARYPLGVMPAEGVGGVNVTRDDLVLRARSGDHDAFDVLARSVTARLYAIALRILRDVHRAEDSVQDSLVDGWRDLRALRDPALFDAWITRILVRNSYRAAKRDRTTRQLTIPTAEHTSDHSSQVAERDRLAQAFGLVDAGPSGRRGAALLPRVGARGDRRRPRRGARDRSLTTALRARAPPSGARSGCPSGHPDERGCAMSDVPRNNTDRPDPSGRASGRIMAPRRARSRARRPRRGCAVALACEQPAPVVGGTLAPARNDATKASPGGGRGPDSRRRGRRRPRGLDVADGSGSGHDLTFSHRFPRGVSRRQRLGPVRRSNRCHLPARGGGHGPRIGLRQPVGGR